MGPITILFGLVLVAIGAAGYFGGSGTSITALIPAFFGTPLVLLGLLAIKDNLRKHAMHAAAMLGLIGCVLPAAMALPKVPALISQGQVLRADGTDATRAIAMQLVMAAVCGVFLVLCVNSFIQARRSRRAAEKPPA